MSNPETGPARPQREITWRSPEILGELILLAIVLGLTIVHLADLHRLTTPSRWLPLIAIAFVVPFWFVRLGVIVKRKRSLEQGAIMDLGFRLGEDPAAERRRAILFVVSVATLFVGVWVVGFHIGLPLWVMLYLRIFSKIPSVFILPIGATFEGFLMGILDYIVNVEWFEPLIFRLIGVEYPFNTWPISGTI